jgi:hypothetical protein
MTEAITDLPRQFSCNGIDYFLYQLDQLMFAAGGKRNVCALAVELDGALDRTALQQQLSQRPVYPWLTGLRFQPGLPFALGRWRHNPNVALPEIIEHHLPDYQGIPDALLDTPIHPCRQPPFRIELAHLPEERSLLFFAWHHSLLDAHGAERFIHSLGHRDAGQPQWLQQASPTDRPSIVQRANIARDCKRFLFESSEPPLSSLYSEQKSQPITQRYRVLRFSAQETREITANAQRLGAGFLVSNFCLAATVCAAAAIQLQRNSLHGDYLIPVPQDRRQRGAAGPVIGNQASFLFYRVSREVLTDLRACSKALTEQTAQQIRQQMPGNFLIMMNLFRRIPGPLYRFLMKQPTAGLMASLYFSDTGDSMQDYQTLFDLPVRSAVHYPPNIYPPGVTIIFTRFRGALQITFGYMQEVLQENEAQQLLDNLRGLLLKGPSTAPASIV